MQGKLLWITKVIGIHTRMENALHVEGDIAVEESRVLIIPDTHWRDTDIKTVGGYCQATTLVAEELLKIIWDQRITHVFHTGDWCDKGYRTLHESFSHRNVLQEMNEATHNRVYMTLGNHFFLERDSNPEMYWIQPNDTYKPVKAIYAKEPLIQLVPELLVGCTQFSFFHFHKTNKMYFRPKLPSAKYHCGIYHDDEVAPAHVRLDEGIRKNIQTSYIKNIYSNIDFGVLGHIHTPVGEVTMQVDGRTVVLDIPGSLSIGSTKASDMHTSVKLPIFTVTDSSVKKEYVTVSLHTDKLKLFGKKETKLPDNQFIPEDLRNTDNIDELMRRGVTAYISAESFLDVAGCSEIQKKLYSTAAKGMLTLVNAVKIVSGKEI